MLLDVSRVVIPHLLIVLTAAGIAPGRARADATCTEVSIVSPAARTAAARTSASCTGCDDEGRVTITFRFAESTECGQFVDGSPWVVADAGGLPIVEITPPVTADCGGGTCNGWMVDIASTTQAFDSRKRFDAGGAPAIRNPSDADPFVAQAGQSIVKAVSFQDEIVGADCWSDVVLGSQPRHCLYFAGVLTVLDAPPPDGTGAGYFRPPYVGTEHPLIPVSEARLDRLPSLPTAGFTNLPALDETETYLCMTDLTFTGGYTSEDHKGFLNVGETRGYNGYVMYALGERLLRALFEDRTPRMAACLVQRGIDLYYMLLPPVSTSWEPNGGHGQGRMMWPYLAAALLGRDDWVAAMNAMDRVRFAERSQVYYSPLADPDAEDGPAGEVLYGSHPAAGGLGQCTESEYFNRCYPDWPGSCNRICADPFALIDGGSPGTSYQVIFTPTARAFALTAHLVPDLESAWPVDDGHALLLEYIDRWMTHGAWTAPDPCDAADPLDPSSPASCTSGPLGTCVCRPGTGRYTDRDGTAVDGGGAYRSQLVTDIWNAFRDCASDCSCEGMEGLCVPWVPPDADAGVGGNAGDGDDGGSGTAPDGGSSDAGSGADSPSGNGGCGCRTSSASSSGTLLLLAFLLWNARRRRRRAQA